MQLLLKGPAPGIVRACWIRHSSAERSFRAISMVSAGAPTGGQHDGTAHASTGRSEVNSGPGTPDEGTGLVPDEKAPGGPASPAPSTAVRDGGEGE